MTSAEFKRIKKAAVTVVTYSNANETRKLKILLLLDKGLISSLEAVRMAYDWTELDEEVLPDPLGKHEPLNDDPDQE